MLKARWKTAFTRFPAVSASIRFYREVPFTHLRFSFSLWSLWSNLIGCVWSSAKVESQLLYWRIFPRKRRFSSFFHSLLYNFYLCIWRLLFYLSHNRLSSRVESTNFILVAIFKFSIVIFRKSDDLFIASHY